MLRRDGGVVYLGVRDAFVRQQERVFARQLLAAHPDRGGSARRTREILAAREAFRRQMASDYAALGVAPLVPVVSKPQAHQADVLPKYLQRLPAVCACGRLFEASWFSSTRGWAKFCSGACPARRALQAETGGRGGRVARRQKALT